MTPSGVVDNSYYVGSFGGVHYSYGRKKSTDTVWNADACFVYQNGSIYDENGHNVSDNSYGRRSPDTNVGDHAWHVRSDGVIDSYDVDGSYGVNLRRIRYIHMRLSI